MFSKGYRSLLELYLFNLDQEMIKSCNKIDLKQYNGKLVVLNFWATWCAPCKKEMPSLDSLYQDNNFKNLEVLAVNMEQRNQ